jgi:hypothetical protein
VNRPSFWLGAILAVALAAGAAWAETERPREERPAPERIADPAAVAGTAQAEAGADTLTAAGEETFSENYPWQDFTVHFVVSLPFTALYSYLTVTTLDALVQGTLPPTLRQADTWVIAGLALGCSLGVALGSVGRVPDQSQTRLAMDASAGPSSAERDPVPARWECVRLTY